jgi:hypothetical protein
MRFMTFDHDRSRYARGCRGNVCKAAERDYQRNRYRRRHGLPVDPPHQWRMSVVSAEGSRGAGPVEFEMAIELATLSAATDGPV